MLQQHYKAQTRTTVTAASNCSRGGNRGSREVRKTMKVDDGEMRRRRRRETAGRQGGRGGDEEGDKDDGMTRMTGEQQQDRGQ
jgi:hypothetical protein